MAEPNPVTESVCSALVSADRVLENIWRTVLDIADIGDSGAESSLALRRVISFNPTAPVPTAAPSILKAISLLQQIVSSRASQVEADPSNPSHFIVLGHCYLLLNDFPNAYAAYANVGRIGSRVEDPYFLYGMGCVYQHFNYNSDAGELLTRALHVAHPLPLKSDLKLRLAINKRALGELDSSITIFEGVLPDPPGGLSDDDIRFQIAFSHQLAGHKERAGSLYHELYSRHRQCLPLIQQYCWFLSLQSDPSSLDLATQIVNAVGTTDPVLKLVTAQIAMKQQDLQAAYHRYCDCIGDWNDSPLFWFKLGVLYFKNEQMKDAIVAFQHALFLKAEVCEAWINLGLICELQGEVEKAMKIYESGMQSCPDAKQLRERWNALSGGRGRANQGMMVELNDSKYFVQVAETITSRFLLDTPFIPPEAVGGGSELAACLGQLVLPHRSLF
jgi:tetratricopeptide (TPR) repeat protein